MTIYLENLRYREDLRDHLILNNRRKKFSNTGQDTI